MNVLGAVAIVLALGAVYEAVRAVRETGDWRAVRAAGCVAALAAAWAVWDRAQSGASDITLAAVAIVAALLGGQARRRALRRTAKA